MNATLEDIAKQANVSRRTVSRVLGDHPYVSEKVRRRVKKAANELNYIPNKLAQSLKSNKTGTIGVLISDIKNALYAELVEKISYKVSDMGWHMILSIVTQDTLEEKRGVVRSLVERRVDGLLSPVTLGIQNEFEDDFVHYARMGIPTIWMVENLSKDTDINGVFFDIQEGMVKAIEYVLTLGHDDIGFVFTPPEFVESRLRAIAKVYEKHRLPISKARIYHGQSHNYHYLAALGIDHFISHGKPPTAIMCLNDAVAVSVIRVLRSRGYRVPEDISVVGFDDSFHAGYSEVPLTTVRLNTDELVERSLELLQRKMDTEMDNPERILVDTEVIVRGSTGAV